MNYVLENIRKIRESMSYSQEAMAEKLNLTQSSYARFERGATKTDLITLERVAEQLGMSVIDLIAYPAKMVSIENIGGGSESELRAILQIELKQDKKDQVLKLVFGDNCLEILNK